MNPGPGDWDYPDQPDETGSEADVPRPTPHGLRGRRAGAVTDVFNDNPHPITHDGLTISARTMDRNRR